MTRQPEVPATFLTGCCCHDCCCCCRRHSLCCCSAAGGMAQEERAPAGAAAEMAPELAPAPLPPVGVARCKSDLQQGAPMASSVNLGWTAGYIKVQGRCSKAVFNQQRAC